MINLPNITLVCIDTVNYGPALNAIYKTLEKIKPARTVFFTDIACAPEGIEVINIKHLYSKDDYSKFMIKELGKYAFDTSHLLVIQHDGYVLDDNVWSDEFLNYGYIGAPWLYVDGRNVGNGGFSLRSVHLHKVLAEDSFIQPVNNEDDVICRMYRGYLEGMYGIKFAPEEIADKFAFELKQPQQPTFGFHNYFHKPYKETIILKRSGAMGDVIQLEPVLEYFHKKGYNVGLDTIQPFYDFFAMHHFPVINYARFDKQVQHRVINLDMSYEVKPKQLHLKSYFEMCGVNDYELRNAKLQYKVTEETRMFKQKYVVIHIDRRATPHRNQFGIHWAAIRTYLENKGYLVIQVGKNEHDDAGVEVNCVTSSMLMWVMAGASLFIGVDSGPSHVAVALGIPSVILFGSVNPSYIHYNWNGITPIYNACPIKKDFCWHEKPGTEGSVCEVNEKLPPCCEYDTMTLITKITHKLL
jgi:hypothetical protein